MGGHVSSLKYWFIRDLGCLSRHSTNLGREHRQDSEKPIGSLFSSPHSCPQTSRLLRSAYYDDFTLDTNFVNNDDFLIRRAYILFWYNLSFCFYDPIFWREKAMLCQTVDSTTGLLHQTHLQNIVSCLLQCLKLVAPFPQAPMQDTDVTSPSPFLHLEPLAHTASMWWVSFFLQ